MGEKMQKAPHRVPKEQIWHMCTEVTSGTIAWDIGLDAGDLGPFLQAEEARYWKSPALPFSEAPDWMGRIADVLIAEADKTVTHFLLLVTFSEAGSNLNILGAIDKAVQRGFERRPAAYVLGVGRTQGLKNGETALRVLAALRTGSCSQSS